MAPGRRGHYAPPAATRDTAGLAVRAAATAGRQRPETARNPPGIRLDSQSPHPRRARSLLATDPKGAFGVYSTCPAPDLPRSPLAPPPAPPATRDTKRPIRPQVSRQFRNSAPIPPQFHPPARILPILPRPHNRKWHRRTRRTRCQDLDNIGKTLPNYPLPNSGYYYPVGTITQIRVGCARIGGNAGQVRMYLGSVSPQKKVDFLARLTCCVTAGYVFFRPNPGERTCPIGDSVVGYHWRKNPAGNAGCRGARPMGCDPSTLPSYPVSGAQSNETV